MESNIKRRKNKNIEEDFDDEDDYFDVKDDEDREEVEDQIYESSSDNSFEDEELEFECKIYIFKLFCRHLERTWTGRNIQTSRKRAFQYGNTKRFQTNIHSQCIF